jgi:hypothetical protein
MFSGESFWISSPQGAVWAALQVLASKRHSFFAHNRFTGAIMR